MQRQQFRVFLEATTVRSGMPLSEVYFHGVVEWTVLRDRMVSE